MSTTTMNVMSVMKVVGVERRAEPRGARIVAELAAQAWRLVAAVFSLLKPAAPRQLTRTEEAAAVRAMATDLLKSDPRFASDLFAAADRHELAGQPRV